MAIYNHFNQRTLTGPQGYQGPQGSNGFQGLTGAAAAANASAIGLQYLSNTWPATEGTSSTSWSTFPSGPTGTVTTGASAIVIISANYYLDVGINTTGYISLSVNDDMTVSTLDARSAAQTSYSSGTQNMIVSVILVSGLTPGSNKFTMVRKSGSAGYLCYFYDRSITVIPG